MRRLFVICILLLYIGYINAQVIENPVFDRSDVPEFHVEKVVITQDTTFIYCFYKAEAGSWARISKDMYLEDANSGARFPLLKASGLPYAPLKREFIFNETIQVILYFPRINTNKFNIIEDEYDRAFNIYEINLSECFITTYDANDFWRFHNMSDYYKSANNDEKFLEFEEKELNAAQYLFGLRTLPVSDCSLQLSEKYNELGNYQKAIEYRLLNLECDSIFYGVENKESPAYPHHLGTLSMYYQNAGNDSASIQCLQKCITIWRKIGNSDNYISSISSLLQTGSDSASIAKGINIVKRELDTLPYFINATSLPVAEIQSKISSCYFRIGDKINAINYCDKALMTLKNSGNMIGEKYAEILSLKCKYLYENGEITDAISSGEAAKQLFESIDIKSKDYAALLSELAGLYNWHSDFEKSLKLEKIAAQIYEEVGEWFDLAESYRNISYYYQSAYDLENAKYYIKKAIRLLEEYDDAKKYLCEKAKMTENPYYKNPYIIATLKNIIDYDIIHFNETLARIYEQEGNLEEAIRTELECVEKIKEQGRDQTILYAGTLLVLSEYYLKDGQYEKALEYTKQSGQILINGEDSELAMQKGMLSMIYYYLGDYEKAVQYGNETLKLQKDDIYGSISMQHLLAVLHYKTQKLSKAEAYLSALLDTYIRIFDGVVEMTTEQKQRLWDKYERDFLLYRNVVKELDNNEAYLSKLYDYVLFSKSFMLYTGINQNNDYLSGLNITWKDIQNVLSEDDIAIEFIATTQEEHEGFTYNALVVDKHCQNPQMIELYSDYDTEMDINTLGEKVWGPILYKYKNARNIFFSADFFFHAFPIEYLIVDGYGLMFEKFNLYRLSSTKEILQKKGKNEKGQAVIYGGLEYNQMADFALEEKTGTLPGMLRTISERGGFEPLYNTLDEVNNIRDLLSSQNIATTLYVGNEGTEESFRKLSGMNVHILHLATHGMYIEPENVSLEKHRQNFDFLESLNNENNPVKEDVTLTHSFLVLSGGNKLIQHNKVLGDDDGILTAKEISETDLKGIDLVVLSACESALGDTNSNGVCGLQRGFKKAGVNTILMSATKVDDEATRILMVEFYKNLMSGNSKLQSLRNAQRYLRGYDNNKYIDYKYWGSFFLLDALN